MKKFFAITLTVLMVAAVFAACSAKKDEGGSAAAQTVVGTWKVETVNGMDPIDAMKETVGEGMLELALGMLGVTEQQYREQLLVMTLNADGTATMSAIGQDGGSGTWTQNGDKVTVTDGDGESAVFTFENGKLSATIEGESMVLVRK